MQRLLLVDDQPENLAAIRRIFADDDYTLHCATTGQEALALVSSFEPDLVVLDIMMPGMDGYEVCRQIKNEVKTAATMVLLLSGKTALDDRLQGYAAAADDYLGKPFNAEELRAKVRILLRLKAAQDELRTLNQDLEHLVAQRTRALISKERQALVGLMVQGIVHNLRSPLTGAVGYVQLGQQMLHGLLLASPDLQSPAQKTLFQIENFLGQAMEAQNNLTSLIDSLLVQGRNDAARETREIDLNQVVRAQLDFLQADLKLKHTIDKVLHLAPELPTLRGIYSDFSQLVGNLIRNATDAMQDSPLKRLTITTRYDQSYLYLEVQDTGCGIAPELSERIYDPFFSTKASRETANASEPTGTGLGLYTCRELLKAYGGEIIATSPADGGSCFQVQLPRPTLVA